ncbi:MAG: hypothetical protein NXY57DRAFT_1043877 [Lentinula lateritia]|nr:MAG: hypothetical protein NXY57DRAFT_1043877 [Lentinula lateritia]
MYFQKRQVAAAIEDEIVDDFFFLNCGFDLASTGYKWLNNSSAIIIEVQVMVKCNDCCRPRRANGVWVICVKKKSGPESEQEDNDNSDVSENTSTWDYINIEGEGEEKYLCLMTPHAEVVQKLYLVLTFSVARTPQGERKLGTKKRKLNKHAEVKDELPENCYNADNRDLGFPPDASISVGVQYDYKLMPDYGKKLFALNKPCLLQPNWRKLNGELIVPWKNYQQLRPGTVVVANIKHNGNGK